MKTSRKEFFQLIGLGALAASFVKADALDKPIPEFKGFGMPPATDASIERLPLPPCVPGDVQKGWSITEVGDNYEHAGFASVTIKAHAYRAKGIREWVEVSYISDGCGGWIPQSLTQGIVSKEKETINTFVSLKPKRLKRKDVYFRNSWA